MRILMTSGGSLHSETALWMGAQFALLATEPPTVLTVVQRREDWAQGEQILARAVRIVSKIVPQVKTELRLGRPEVEILAAAAAHDLLIMGERQFHSLRTRLLGAVTERVARQAPCSLLIAKGKIEPIRRVLICDSGTGRPTVLQRFLESGLSAIVRGDVEVLAKIDRPILLVR